MQSMHNKTHLLAFVHNLFLAPNLDRRKFFHILLVVPETFGNFVVERVDQILQRSTKGLREIVRDGCVHTIG